MTTPRRSLIKQRGGYAFVLYTVLLYARASTEFWSLYVQTQIAQTSLGTLTIEAAHYVNSLQKVGNLKRISCTMPFWPNSPGNSKHPHSIMRKTVIKKCKPSTIIPSASTASGDETNSSSNPAEASLPHSLRFILSLNIP